MVVVALVGFDIDVRVSFCMACFVHALVDLRLFAREASGLSIARVMGTYHAA